MAFDLASVLSNVSDSDTAREQIEYIKLDLIEEDPNNFYQLTGVEELAANIQLCGLQQPIRVRPIPGESERYRIVSGHRRRAALVLLAKENPERWSEAACIVEDDEVSPALQQLRLIYANANTRTMTNAELSEQAVQVEKLLYQLKEEGYEFPGRMRDHVAQAVNASKTKLARLKVIRENLSHVWSIPWKKGKLNESVAYEMAQLPETWQQVIYEARGENGYLDAKYIKIFKERFGKIEALKCKKMAGYEFCHNMERKQQLVASNSPYNTFYCDKCCGKCPELATCKNVCPVMEDKAKKLRADKREARKQEIAAEREKERPTVERVESIWHRFGEERILSGKSVKDVKNAAGDYYWSNDLEKYEKLESGTKKVTPATKLPYGIYADDVSRLTALADLFGCSIDYLLCRTDVREMAQEDSTAHDSDTDAASDAKEPEFIPDAWYPASVEPPVGVPLVLIDSDGYTDTGKYKGCGEFTMDFGDPVTFWTLMPDEKGTAQTVLPVAGWQSGTPEESGTYAAYVRIEGVSQSMLRELYWNGEWWSMHNERIADEIQVEYWAVQPEFAPRAPKPVGNGSCITGCSPTGHCGAVAYCSEDYTCCFQCPEDCSIRCGFLDAEDAK